jgi:tyrosyl-tRNA synthetase
MSGSKGNYIGLTEAPEEMFGKTMRIPDEQLAEWWTLVAEQPVPAGDPMAAKLALARWIVARSHGEEAARAAEDHFTRVVRRHEAPEEVEEVELEGPDPLHLPAFLAAKLGESSSHWRRTIDQGGVKLDGNPVPGYDVAWADLDGVTLQAGKRRFLRLVRV